MLVRVFTVLLLACALAPAAQARSWSDEFSGEAGAPPNPAHWWSEQGAHGWNGELENYTDNAHLDGLGHLVITATKTDEGYDSARLESRDRFEFRYGTVSARIQTPVGAGLWPSFWLLGADVDSVGWPTCGEIDVMESLGQDTVYGSTHGIESHFATNVTPGFHVYTARWQRNSIKFYVDGLRYGYVSASFDKPMFLILNLAVGGDWPGPPDASTVFPAAMVVDWVRVRTPRV